MNKKTLSNIALSTLVALFVYFGIYTSFHFASVDLPVPGDLNALHLVLAVTVIVQMLAMVGITFFYHERLEESTKLRGQVYLAAIQQAYILYRFYGHKPAKYSIENYISIYEDVGCRFDERVQKEIMDIFTRYRELK